MEPRRLAYIDSLRCIAASAVVAQHLLERVDPVAYAGFLDTAPGVFGVVLFFYISGLVIPLSVQKRPPLVAFALRRFFRIYPAYLATIAFVTLLAFVRRDPSPFSNLGWEGSLMNILLLHEFMRIPAILTVTWTLAIEFVWYGLFALIFYGVHRIRVSWLVLGFSASMIALSLASLYFGVRVPAGRIGLIGAALVGYATWQFQAGALRTREYVTAVVSFACSIGFSLYVAFGVFSHETIRLHHSLLPWAGATALFLAATWTHAEGFRRALSWRPLVFVGAISYSLYLVHGAFVILSIELLQSSWAIPVALSLAVLTAWLFHRLVELPGVGVGKRLEKAWIARTAASADEPAYVQSSR